MRGPEPVSPQPSHLLCRPLPLTPGGLGGSNSPAHPGPLPRFLGRHLPPKAGHQAEPARTHSAWELPGTPAPCHLVSGRGSASHPHSTGSQRGRQEGGSRASCAWGNPLPSPRARPGPTLTQLFSSSPPNQTQASEPLPRALRLAQGASPPGGGQLLCLLSFDNRALWSGTPAAAVPVSTPSPSQDPAQGWPRRHRGHPRG